MKELINNFSTRIPESLSELIMAANQFPQIIYGNGYRKIRDGALQYPSDQTSSSLKRVLDHAVNSVSYYRQRYRKFSFTSIDQFVNEIGFTNKNLVASRFDEFLTDNLDVGNYVEGTTGGTSGPPMRLVIPKNRYLREIGTLHCYWQQFGYRHARRAVLRNHRLIHRGYTINPFTKEYIFDGFELNAENFELMHQVMEEKDIRFLQCYPSSAFEFISFLNQTGRDTSFISALFLSSENLYDYQKDLFNRLRVPLFSLYGHSEKLCIAGFCQHSQTYHVSEDYGYLELIGPDGSVITEPGKHGEIVGTTLNNFGMPLIRFQTGDFSSYVSGECVCGFRGRRLSDIQGRWHGERLFNRNGTFVTATALNLHDSLYSSISGIQYKQSTPGVVDVLVVPNGSFDDDYVLGLEDEIGKKFSADTVVTVRLVDELERETNGKFRLVVGNLDE